MVVVECEYGLYIGVNRVFIFSKFVVEGMWEMKEELKGIKKFSGYKVLFVDWFCNYVRV